MDCPKCRDGVVQSTKLTYGDVSPARRHIDRPDLGEWFRVYCSEHCGFEGEGPNVDEAVQVAERREGSEDLLGDAAGSRHRRG